MSKSVRRLYEQFKPAHYQLDLAPDRTHKKFTGSVIIAGQKVGRPSQRLTFHQHGLKITAAEVTHHSKKGQRSLRVDRINSHKNFDEVRLHFKVPIHPGRYQVRLTFAGDISRQMNGIYPCFFKEDGKDKELVATQFESHHAREVFPCIDEPEAKATFDLTLTSPKGEVVLANTPVRSQTLKGNQQTTTFETTPIMSTYLLAFVYGNLSYKESKTKSGVVVRTYATKSNVELTDFALQTAVKCLDFYEEYFNIKYPLAKCDLVALPDFSSMAMENWGLITFRDLGLVVDPKHTTLASQQIVALVVAHELTHQWFGNLVTMRWWTDLWLNEGFATWMEYLAVDHLFPDWQIWTQFIVDEQQQALKLDALEHTHPIEVAVKHPDEIRTIFDVVSYSKGASVIHMLHDYLGPESFRDGLRHYLATHSYSNTDTVDLWKSLEDISGKPVRQFMHAWTAQAGFPVIESKLNEDGLLLKQRRFFANPRHSKQPNNTWPVPLLVHGQNGVLPESLNKHQISLKHSDDQAIKLNTGQSGFYRTVYNATQLENLGKQIDRGHFEPLDRLGILSDLFESAKAGYSDTSDALHFLEHYRSEDDYVVWDTISASLGSLRLMMDDESLREAMKPYTRKLVSVQLKRLGWNRRARDSHFDRLLRPIILGMAAGADEPSVVERCQELFASVKHAEDIAPDLQAVGSRKRLKRGTDIDPDLRGTVFGTAARLGDKKTFDKLLKLHNDSQSSEERTILCAAITGFRQPELVDKALAMITSDEVRLQDVAYWIAYSFLNRHAKHLTWQWLKDNWQWLESNLGSDLSFYRMPIYVARVFSDESFLADYKKFFMPNMSPALERSYNQGLEMIEWQSAWKSKVLGEVKAFFKSDN